MKNKAYSQEVVVGQTWRSRGYFRNIGHYTVEIISVDRDTVKTRFTASEWSDHHWVNGSVMSIMSLLDSYELVKNV